MRTIYGFMAVAAAFTVLAKEPVVRSEPPPPPALPPPPASMPKPPKLIGETRAFIPTEVLRRVSGVVQLRLRIGKDGTVRQVDVLSGPEEIANPLAAAARKWVYESTRVKGRRVEVTTTIIINLLPPPMK